MTRHPQCLVAEIAQRLFSNPSLQLIDQELAVEVIDLMLQDPAQKPVACEFDLVSLEVERTGYTADGKVLRFADVKVAAGARPTAGERHE